MNAQFETVILEKETRMNVQAGHPLLPVVPPAKRAASAERIFEEEAWPHFSLLLGAAHRATGGDHAEAEDLVQQVYMQAWRSFAAYMPGTNCRAWLFRILFFKLKRFNHARAERRARVIYLDDVIAEYEPYLTPQPTVLNDDREAIQHALNQVGAPFREVVELALVEEFSYREIAAQLEIPIGTVMSRLSRGRALLRKTLAP